MMWFFPRPAVAVRRMLAPGGGVPQTRQDAKAEEVVDLRLHLGDALTVLFPLALHFDLGLRYHLLELFAGEGLAVVLDRLGDPGLLQLDRLGDDVGGRIAVALGGEWSD